MNILFFIVLILLIIFLLLCAVFLYMIKPRKRRDTSYFEGKMYAHRGLHDDTVPENSLTAIKLAKEGGYGVELDVQMTKDGQLVVFHDGNLKRMCGHDGFIKDFTYEELLSFSLKDTDEIIPLFSNVLEVLGETDIICEIKPDNGNKCYTLCEKTMDMLKTYPGKYCIESFSPYLVAWVKDRYPEIIRGQLSENFVKHYGFNFVNFALTHLLVNVVSRPDFVAYNHHDDRTFGYRICRVLFKPFLVAWTAKGEKEQEYAKNHFEAVIFEKNPPKEDL